MEDVLSLPPEPNEKPRAYEAFLFWLQNGKVLQRAAEQMGVNINTIKRWRSIYHWDERALIFEQQRAITPYNKEQSINDMMNGYALAASEAVISTAMDDYNAMVALWRASIEEASRKEGGMTGKELRDFFAARDVLDQMGRRVARLPAAYKSTINAPGTNSNAQSIGDKHVEDEINWN